MDIITLQSLAEQIGTANGYISTNRSGEQLEIKGSNFLGKMVVWVRFKLNQNYKEAALTAKRKVMLSLLSDKKYGDDFQRKINPLDPQGKFFYEAKPLSARKVYRFIENVRNEATQRVASAKDWVDRWSDKASTITSRENFQARTEAMLEEKMKDVRGVKIEDLDLKDLSDTVNNEALSDHAAMKRITGKEDAKEHVDRVLSEVLDQRIAAARLKLQDKLKQELAGVGLADEVEQSITSEIADTTIVTIDELKSRVEKEVLKQIGYEFDDLLKEAQSKHNFNEHLAQLPEVKEQLQMKLRQRNQDQMLLLGDVRKQAMQLLDQWVKSKQETLSTIKTSQFTGTDNLLKRLALENPYIGKLQIEYLQWVIEQTLEEVYNRNADSYEALGMDKGKLLSKLHQFVRKDSLFNNLRDLFRQSPKPDSLFNNNNWQTADIRGVVENCVETISDPMAESYKKILPLKGQVPDYIYETLVDQVAKGRVYDPEFVSVANQLHIDTLTKNDSKELYGLLQSPQVAQKRIGSKADLAHFTLEDVLKKMLSNKDMQNADKKRKAINAIMPEEIKDKLLDELEGQLAMVKSRIMSEADVKSLFQRGAIRFLRAQNINFEEMKIIPESKAEEAVSTIYETPL